MNIPEINEAIKMLPENQKELVSDGYHTFKELYSHRVKLFVALLNTLESLHYRINYPSKCWKSKLHADGTMFDGWFIAWIGTEKWETLTYHLPDSEWEKLKVWEIEKAPEWDGHTSDDVLNLLSNI